MALTLYKFQEDALNALTMGRRIALMGVGSGKTAVAMRWARHQASIKGKHKVLVITTASKRSSGDMEIEADRWCEGWRGALEVFEVVSWHGLVKWLKEHEDYNDYVIIMDEIHKAGAGVSSQMGRAFLKITKTNKDWRGFTATPGDNWLKFYPYFVACGFYSNKTEFMHRHAIVQTFKGFPEIKGWRDEETLLRLWHDISVTPDTSQMNRELPSEQHIIYNFKTPKDYGKVLKTRLTIDGEELDNTMALAHYLRQLCFSREKEQWLTDFLEGLGENAVIFYSYKDEGDKIADIAKRLKVKVWRIDGLHHDIPTSSTIGKTDIVLCQWQSGAEGLNLQFIRHWISTTPNYSYATSTQARGRIRRIGQTRPMVFHYLKCEKTIEGDIYQALHDKRDFSEDIWGKNIE